MAAAAEQIKSCFRRADTNKDGLISRSELEATFRKLGAWSDAEFDVLFESADANADGKLQYTEFVNWVMADADSKALVCNGLIKSLSSAYPYLDHDHHILNKQWVEAKEAVEKKAEDAEDKLKRIDAELHNESCTLKAAFTRFDTTGTGVLKRDDIQQMATYLGFPDSDEDIDEFMKAMDKDGTGVINEAEFEKYVGNTGGSLKLFEQRRARIEEKGGFSEGDPEAARLALKEAGVEDDAQAYWRLVVSPTEFEEVAKLVKCQKDAVALIRRLSRKNHDDALPKLQHRIKNLGFKESELYMSLAWIRELAPVVIHLNLDKILQFMETDTHYRNQFETGTGGGTLSTSTRSRWEKALFGGHYDDANGFDRCKYGVLNVMNDYRGVIKCAQYGDSYCIMKDVRLRCTFAPCDSSVCSAEKLAVLDYYAHVLNDYEDGELKETIRVANSKDAALVGNSENIYGYNYKEAQYHGEVRWDTHIERLVAHQRHRSNPDMANRITAVAEKYGWAFSWMDDEKQRMANEDLHKLGSEAWKERLKKLEDKTGDFVVPEGFCKVGCGRKVCPGLTRGGNPFTTCCKGCVMGFGHDLTCGKIDGSKLGVGLCKNGCGKKVAFGRDGKGRSFTTCCRGCAVGGECSENCQVVPEIEEGKCKFGCGRNVAPGEWKGRAFDTCCRNCARGSGHSDDCAG